MKTPIYQVDAFTSRRFGGNPAAVCPLANWPSDTVLQQIAAENNLAETVFFVREPDGIRLRWFTPAVEVDLCGHATLAAAYVLMECLGFGRDQINFQSRSGRLTVSHEGDRYVLDFPSRPAVPAPTTDILVAALGLRPAEVLAARDLLCVFSSQQEVAALQPDWKLLREVDGFAVIATSPGEDCDFVSRFFAPKQGLDEDPVTGSAHCTLIPYWSKRLGKAEMFARQISTRGGELWCEDHGDRVRIGGQAVLYLSGFIDFE